MDGEEGEYIQPEAEESSDAEEDSEDSEEEEEGEGDSTCLCAYSLRLVASCAQVLRLSPGFRLIYVCFS